MAFRSLLFACLLLAGCDRPGTPKLTTQADPGSQFEGSHSGILREQGYGRTSLPVFTSQVGSRSDPVVVGVEMCSRDRMRCVWDSCKEVCQLAGEAEAIFNFNGGHGYLGLADDKGIANVVLQETSAEGADMRTFESADGRMSVTLLISNSSEPRGRAEGPGLVGTMTVELDGEKVPYLYPSPRTQIHGSVNCNPVDG